MKKVLILGLFFLLLILPGCSLKRAQNKDLDNSNQTRREPNLPQEVNSDSRLVTKDTFSLEAPANWLESSTMVPGVSLMMVNSTEKNDRPEVKNINFRSYFSVSYDTLGEKTFEQYAIDLKGKLAEMITGISFQPLDSVVIDGRSAQVFSADLTQQGVGFKVLMFVAAGKNKDVWLISFNTLPESFSGYQGLFFKIATSFKVK